MTAQPHDDLSVLTWRFGNVSSAGKNTRCIPVTDGVSFPPQPPKIQLCTEDDPPLEVVQFVQDDCKPGGGPKTLVLKVPEGSSLLQSLQALDRYALEVAEKKSTELFKKQFKPEQLQPLYTPIMKDSLLSLRVDDDLLIWKLLARNTSDASQKLITSGASEDVLPGGKVWLCAEVKALYFLPRSFGLVLTASDVLVFPREKSKAFPFVSRTLSFSFVSEAVASSIPIPEEDGNGEEDH